MLIFQTAPTAITAASINIVLTNGVHVKKYVLTGTAAAAAAAAAAAQQHRV